MREKRSRMGLLLLGILLYAMGAGAYFTLRFAGHWSEGDTARVTQAIEEIYRVGSLTPDLASAAYPRGSTYTVLSAFLMEITGISGQTLTTYVYPLTVALIAFVGFALYRRLTGSTSAALLAALFLYLQPDFLWVTFRGSHEKVIWTLVLMAFLLLAKSFAAPNRRGVLERYVFLFYLVTFALIATNVLFASSFIAALILVFLGGSLALAVRRRRKMSASSDDPSQIQRLFYVTASCAALLYLFMFHIYPLARSGLWALRTLAEGGAALLLNFDVPVNPYEYVAATWTSPLTYVALTLFNYTVLLISFVVWVRGIPRFLKVDSLTRSDLPQLFLWLLYPAFALQLAVSAIVDRAGVVGGNLQVRLLTPMMIIAIPLAAMGLLQAWQRVRPGPLRGAAMGLMVLLVGWFGLAALLKATNEPALSNQWLFNTRAERQAGAWITRHIASAEVWVGVDGRIPSAMEFTFFPHEGITFDGWSIKPGTRYFLLSTFERMKYARLDQPPPYFLDENAVYDNGEAQLYYRRPLTPYQR